MKKTINDYLTKIPSWLRWVLFIPASAILSVITPYIFSFVTRLSLLIVGIGMGGLIKPYWIYFASSYLGGVIFILSTALIVPKYKFIVSLIMTVIITFISSGSIFIIMRPDYTSLHYALWIEVLSKLIIIVAAAITTIHIHKHEDELNEI